MMVVIILIKDKLIRLFDAPPGREGFLSLCIFGESRIKIPLTEVLQPGPNKQ